MKYCSVIALLTVSVSTVVCHAQGLRLYPSIARDRLNYLNSVGRNNLPVGAETIVAARMEEQRQRESERNQKEFPWMGDTSWRKSTNYAGVLDRLITKNGQEMVLLRQTGANEPNTPRLRQLKVWLVNENKALQEQYDLQHHIESEYRLHMFYHDHNKP